MKAPSIKDYPKKVCIGPARVPYKVRFVDVPRSKFLGQCSFKRQTIKLNKNQNREALFMTYLHELLHAMEFESGNRVPHKIIYRFESQLYFFIMNNLTAFNHRRTK